MDTAHEVIMTISTEANLSDAEIAARVGYSQPTIWRLRAGKTKSCSSDLYRALCTLRAEIGCGGRDRMAADRDATVAGGTEAQSEAA